jgi:glutaredoxin
LRRSAYDADLAAKLRALAERVRRNVPLRSDPERFHVEKACLCQDLEHLARRLEERSTPQLTINRQHRTMVLRRS